MKAEKEKGKEKRNENKKKEAPRRPIGPREAACRSLVRLEKEGRFSNIELDTVLRSAGFSSADRGLYTRLVYGVLERKLTLDYLIGNLAERPAESLDLPLRTLLRLGLCQLLFFDRIPESAAVNESVEIAKKLCPKGAGMVNAVLRRFLREGKRLRLPSGEEDPDLYLSVRYSVSPRLCGCLREDYGMEKAESILSAFCTPPPITLRVNTLRTGAGGAAFLPAGAGLCRGADPLFVLRNKAPRGGGERACPPAGGTLLRAGRGVPALRRGAGRFAGGYGARSLRLPRRQELRDRHGNGKQRAALQLRSSRK